jgi:hypothetical protein
VKDLQEKYPNIILIDSSQNNFIVKQPRVSDTFNVAEFIEESMEEEKAGIKKEVKVLEEGGSDISDDIPEDIEKKLRDEECELRKIEPLE